LGLPDFRYREQLRDVIYLPLCLEDDGPMLMYASDCKATPQKILGITAAICYSYKGASKFPARQSEEPNMSDHVYKTLELTGTSKKSIEEAVRGAIAKASKTVRNMHWFEVVETRGHVENGQVAHWQVTIKAGFTLDD
jgi:hypothetical protein